MRVLAIRGENLASLAGPFELLLADGPLAHVGLFSITGPTGAGKSTLLDAMCLALFDTTPRLLSHSSTVLVGRDGDETVRLRASDPRSLVRKGAGFGFAEVDYEGRDGKRYRARWEARRARSLPGGKFQPQAVTLRELTSDAMLGGTKTETLAEIERTLGLSFEQFSRAALLAQGAFAAFLQEKGEKRAELLEQMTGTEVYQRISKAAHEKAVSVKAALADMERAAGGVVVLDDEARDSLVRRIADLKVAINVSERGVETLASALRWHDERRRHESLVAEARDALAHASAQGESLEVLRETLARVLEARMLRPLVESEEAARRTLAEARRTLDVSAAACEAAVAEANAAEANAAEANAAHKTASDEVERNAPTLAHARALDARLAEREGRLREAASEHKSAETSRDDARAELGALAERLAESEANEAAERAWLVSRDGARRLALQWDATEKALGLYVSDSARAKSLAAEHARLSAEASQAERAKEEHSRQRDVARQQRDACKEARDVADRAARGARLDDADRATRDRIAETRPKVEQLVAWLAESEVREASLAKERAAATEAAASAEAARAEAARLDAALSRAEGAAEAAAEALARMQVAASLDEHRATLKDGEPCPLCGASEHPYAGERLSSLLGTQAADVASTKERVRELARLRDEQKAELAKCEERVALIAREVASLEEAKEKARVSFERVSADVRVVAQGDGVKEALWGLRETLDAEHRALQEKETRFSSFAHALDERTRDLDAAELALSNAASAFDDAAERERAAARTATECEREAAFARDACARLLVQMKDAFAFDAGWQARVQTDAESFRAAYADEVAEVRRRETNLATFAEARAQMATRRDSLSAKCDELVRRTEAALVRFVTEESAVLALRGERASLFEGRATEDVEAALKESTSRSASALRDAEKARTEADAKARTAREKLAAEQSTLAHAERALAAAQEKLALALSERGLSSEALVRLLAHDDAWVESSQATLKEADLALANAKVVLREREKSFADHHTKTPAEGLPHDLDAAVEAARAELRHAQDERVRAAGTLERDEAARASQAAQRQAFEKARIDAERWLVLDSLIGSADGKKFRTFAQSLTLDGLLAYANQHLRDLAPRYRLERVPQHDMELQIVDADMGDEVRGTSSLSGGETFLVSLALALALSSLAARDVRIDTLFVDEGFGSLDPVTLDVALSALDSLQATGRQIGVISHVRALADKVGTQVRVERVGGGRSRLIVHQDA